VASIQERLSRLPIPKRYRVQVRSVTPSVSGHDACIGPCFLGVLAVLSLFACQPKDRRPGLWLSGDVETAPVTDWSFVDAHREIFVETRSRYGIPHSVTTVCVAHNGTLYVPSGISRVGSFPTPASGTATWCATRACA